MTPRHDIINRRGPRGKYRTGARRIYLIEAADAFKVGMSTGPYFRMHRLARQVNRGRLELRYSADGEAGDERAIHKRLSAWLVDGREWFAAGAGQMAIAVEMLRALPGFVDERAEFWRGVGPIVGPITAEMAARPGCTA